MNLDNVVLVRAMDRLPLMGMIMPHSKGFDYEKIHFKDYYDILSKIIKEKLEQYIGRSLDLSNIEDKRQFENIFCFWYPLVNFYTSTLRFSFNGLLDSDNIFRLAMIDPIKNHQSDDFINVDNIGVTMKGTFKVSKDAIFVIREDYYKTLSLFTKEELEQNFKFEIFNGSLKEALEKTLKKYNYPVMPLIKNNNIGAVAACAEKEEMLAFQDSFAKMTNASRLTLEELATKDVSGMREVDLLAAEKVKSDIEKNCMVEKYYLNKFYTLLVEKAEKKDMLLSAEEKHCLFSYMPESKIILEKLINHILLQYGGLNGLKVIVDEFNDNLILSDMTYDQIFALAGVSRK